MVRSIILSLVITIVSGCSTFKSDTISRPSPIVQTNQQAIKEKLSEDQRTQIVLFSMSLIDGKYKWGGKQPSTGLDCSGLVSYVYKNAININLTGNTTNLMEKTKEIDISNAKPGDLIFFNTRNKPYSHVGVYIGNNRFIHSPSSKSQIKIDRLDQGFYSKKLQEARMLPA